MSRVHDMGGRFGDGPVGAQEHEPVFKEDWHARALAVTLAAGALGQWNLDISRHARERLIPQDYAGFSYYEKWLAGLANLLVEQGVVSTEELASGDGTASDLAGRKLPAEKVAATLAAGGPADRETNATPRFSPGDYVRTLPKPKNRFHAGGHTRLPAYAANAQGRVLLYHGTHVLPDASAHGQGEAPEPLYTVVFQSKDLWHAAENPHDEVTLDLWESYLVAP